MLCNFRQGCRQLHMQLRHVICLNLVLSIRPPNFGTSLAFSLCARGLCVRTNDRPATDLRSAIPPHGHDTPRSVFSYWILSSAEAMNSGSGDIREMRSAGSRAVTILFFSSFTLCGTEHLSARQVASHSAEFLADRPAFIGYLPHLPYVAWLLVRAVYASVQEWRKLGSAGFEKYNTPTMVVSSSVGRPTSTWNVSQSVREVAIPLARCGTSSTCPA